jgi:hypothetical protein
MSSGSIGGRAINFEAKRDVEALADIPQAILRDIPKANIKVMRQLSTHVRQTVMDAAAKMGPGELLDYIDACHPDQHSDINVCMKFKPERSGAALIEEALTWAIEHELAGTRDEAIIRMAETALEDWKLDHELEEVMNNAANA